jgi:hypothetical protein
MDRAALMMTLANMALQLLAMLWLLLTSVSYDRVLKALLRAPRKASRSVSRLLAKGRSDGAVKAGPEAMAALVVAVDGTPAEAGQWVAMCCCTGSEVAALSERKACVAMHV